VYALAADFESLQTRVVDAGVKYRPHDRYPGLQRLCVEDCFDNRRVFLQPAP